MLHLTETKALRSRRCGACAAVAAVAAVLVIAATGATAQTTPPPHPNYVPVSGDDDTMILVETRSMTNEALWMAFAWRAPQSDGAVAAVTQQQVDCAKSTTREMYRASYGISGRLLGTNAVPMETSQPVAPDSQLAAVLDFVCRGTTWLDTNLSFRSPIEARRFLLAH